MPKYVIAYLRGRQLGSPPERAAHIAKWKSWIEGLGAAVVNSGTPLGRGKLISTTGVLERGPNCLTGFSIVSADDFDAAIEIAQRCPFLDIGTIELAEVMEMR